MWLSSDEALQRLRVKPQSLYASVSRGRIRARLTGGADWEDEAIITRLQKLMTEP